jgi:hypothetical protein
MVRSFSAGVDPRRVKGDLQLLRKRSRELKIRIGFCAAQTVVQMCGMQNKAQFPALCTIPFGKRAQQRH